MDSAELFDVWAPAGAAWSPWAKPVLFAAQPSLPPPEPVAPMAEAAPLLPRFQLTGSPAVVVDLPGARSVQAGLALAREGFRPVPLYNGSDHPAALVSVQPIVREFETGAGSLAGLRLSPDAPPAFLLDAERQTPRGGVPGRYDNRWLVFPQDFPSASFLRSRQISRVVLLQEPGSPQPAEDLAHVLRRWQEAGLEIFLTHPGEGSSPVPLQVEKPSRFRDLSYRALAVLGLRRNSAGGFGSVIPLPSSRGGGGFG
ncbi:MAG TPA: hypothetical protein VEW48_12980 [Thermoanaerobaculia bacterium]|nr:hypothetical protein [Thermoanaerobaculia bacterium]